MKPTNTLITNNLDKISQYSTSNNKNSLIRYSSAFTNCSNQVTHEYYLNKILIFNLIILI